MKTCKVSIKLIHRPFFFFTEIDLHDYDINNKDSNDTDTSSETEDNKFPDPLTSLFNPENINFPEDKIKAEGELRYHSSPPRVSHLDAVRGLILLRGFAQRINK